ncbi:squalene synthase family protein [Hibiscus syriacus]|uniref:GATA transcription factor n=1 Tax=Hibiscus syriacus TaxID=106335 RepID=A0A6A3BJZ4_HIBSY|nr:GATA transcription factor 5-like [Hibiscus syriacus]XP_039068540.1 GATA transcription factor 5-like [Hibiscus syriacus]KAE8716873.1 squalene synthase family protein [Hibiscus syriacus]
MEFCMEERALKSSVRGELTMQKNNQHAVFDDLLCLNGAVPGEDFSVDCFFDFTNGEFDNEENSGFILSQEQRLADDDSNSNSSSFSFDSVLTNELSVPDEEIAGLEWVSQFVDDSVPELHFPCPVFKESQAKARFESSSAPVFVKTPCFSSPVPSKSRSKRAKPTGKAWPVGSLPLSESSSSTTASSSSSASSGFSMTSALVLKTELTNDFSEQPTKKQRKKPGVQASGGSAFQRRCSHCQVQKTPQWRTGPLGAKTLCNACGVRYKSGRLFPEYRPACSPTFSGDVHSNSHRKVLEMRRKKEVAEGKVSDELTRMIPSF